MCLFVGQVEVLLFVSYIVLTANNYEVVEAGEVITFRGLVKKSISQACFLVFCTVLAMASFALVLQIQLQDFSELLYDACVTVMWICLHCLLFANAVFVNVLLPFYNSNPIPRNKTKLVLPSRPLPLRRNLLLEVR